MVLPDDVDGLFREVAGDVGPGRSEVGGLVDEGPEVVLAHSRVGDVRRPEVVVGGLHPAHPVLRVVRGYWR